MSNLWVIGGTSGIGEAIANMAIKSGQFDEVLATGIEHDVRVSSLLMELYHNDGPFSHFVYSAGINDLDYIQRMGHNRIKDIFDTNVFGFMRLLSLVTSMQKSGRVLAISSDAAVRPMRTSMAYCSSKAALDMTVKCAARELAPSWQINALSPGMTAPTHMQQYIDETVPELRGWGHMEAREYETSQIPMGRRAHVDEVAEMALSILHAPEYLTGSIVTMNGGR